MRMARSLESVLPWAFGEQALIGVRVAWRPRLRFLRNRSRAQAARGWAAMVETSSPSRWVVVEAQGRRQRSEAAPGSRVWEVTAGRNVAPSHHHTRLRIVVG